MGKQVNFKHEKGINDTLPWVLVLGQRSSRLAHILVAGTRTLASHHCPDFTRSPLGSKPGRVVGERMGREHLKHGVQAQLGVSVASPAARVSQEGHRSVSSALSGQIAFPGGGGKEIFVFMAFSPFERSQQSFSSDKAT